MPPGDHTPPPPPPQQSCPDPWEPETDQDPGQSPRTGDTEEGT